MRRSLASGVVAGVFGLTSLVQAQPFTPVTPYAGGVNPRPDITSVVVSNNRVRVNWTGFQSPYKVYWTMNDWATSNLAGTVYSTKRMMTLLCPTSTPTGATFRVTGPTPKYASAYGRCSTCHGTIAREWVATPHAVAFDLLVDCGEDGNTNCLACHTVGYGLSTGYVESKPYMADVQCENCHGPVGGHAGKYNTPGVTLSATLCAGCHEGSDPDNHSIFQDWETAGHAEVTEDVALYFANSVVATSQGRMGSCGFCHSGAVRLALLKKEGALPDAKEASEIGQTCVICHDPHNEHPENGGYHLRNPMFSTNNYNFATSQPGAPAYSSNKALNYGIAYTNFWAQYNPNVMICAQCHNARGATVGTTNAPSSRPPHHSPQYNLLMGNIGVTTDVVPPVTTTTTAYQSPHGAKVAKQCIQCHMAKDSTGLHAEHTFEPDMTTNTCGTAACHGASDPVAIVAATQADIQNRINGVVGQLQLWASTKAPFTPRNINSWEFQTMGSLSSTNNGASPGATNQKLVPNDIHAARFNLYLVAYDGSYGVHNANYARYLLNVASNKVQALLDAP